MVDPVGWVNFSVEKLGSNVSFDQKKSRKSFQRKKAVVFGCQVSLNLYLNSGNGLPDHLSSNEFKCEKITAKENTTSTITNYGLRGRTNSSGAS